MFHILRRPNVKTLITRQLAEADREFLQAVANAEHWAAIADMLARRRERLQSYLEPKCEPAETAKPLDLSFRPENASPEAPIDAMSARNAGIVGARSNNASPTPQQPD